MNQPLLDIQGLTVRFATRGGAFTAVDGVNLQVARGAIHAFGIRNHIHLFVDGVSGSFNQRKGKDKMG